MAQGIVLILLAVFVGFVTSTVPVPPIEEKCKNPDEQHYICKPECKNTCANHGKTDVICPSICISGCFCQPHLVADGLGNCVLPTECSKKTCHSNEIHDDCEQPKDCVTCEHKELCPPLLCTPGCNCKPGFYRNKFGMCIPKSLCPKPIENKCPKPDEQYYQCIPDCKNTCANYGKTDVICTAECKSGCFCKSPLVADANRKCVLPKDCPKKICPLNEEHGCEQPKDCVTCEHKETCPTLVCSPGCNCKPGFYRNQIGNCIPKALCPPPGGQQCIKPDEVYYPCIPDCKNTCANYGKTDVICTAECKPGCFCKSPLVADANRKCVLPKDCPKKICPLNEEHGCEQPKDCVTCEHKEQCPTLVCSPGCNCKPGFYRNKLGNCIAEALCPSPVGSCGKNEEYRLSGPVCEGCGIRCQAIANVAKCYCKKGFSRTNDGICIQTKDCPTNQICPTGEIYSDCGSGCPATCDDGQGISTIACAAVCVKGCFCPPGYLRDKSSKKCVLPQDCPQTDVCSEREIYKKCGSACPPTCDNYKTELACPTICVPGCFCVKGFVLDESTGKCVLPMDCPRNEICPAGEIYNDCGSACPPTCDDRNGISVVGCPTVCVKGCFCPPGLLRDMSSGRCVFPSNCPQKVCPMGEVYDDCGSGCPATCDDGQGISTIACAAVCVKGCFCPPGFLRDKSSGKCVSPHNCPQNKICPAGEIYDTCGSACPPTCSNQRNSEVACPAVCVEGCFCPPGLVRDESSNTCVLPKNCPQKHICPAGEFYDDCGSACPPTCDNQGISTYACPAVCVSDCFCVRGLVRDTSSGKCVFPQNCPRKHICPAGEIYNDCGSACPPTCDIRGVSTYGCGANCVSGCFCQRGFVRDMSSGRCVLPQHCPQNVRCRPNEIYSECGSSCAPSCADLFQPPRACAAVCVKGCFCRTGFVRDFDGKSCVRPRDCRRTRTPVCRGLNEEYSKCVVPCNGCEIRGKCQFFVCNKGCDCIPNHYRFMGTCIPEKLCPCGKK